MVEPSIDDAFAAVCTEYERFTTQDPVGKVQLEAIKRDLRETYASKHRVLSSAAAICIDRFVAAELDFTTPNARGLGRITDHIPRFAAKHRDVFNNMRHDSLMSLRSATKKHIICAYLYLDFYYQLPEQDSDRSLNGVLFDNWISTIYVPPSELGPKSKDEGDIRGLWFAATGRMIRHFAEKAGIRWDARDALGTDQTIITHYFDAGLTLRYSEAMIESR